MDVQNWLSSPKTIMRSKKQYAHFDYRTNISICRDYISNPQKIATHGFYPFIHYKKEMVKYSKAKGKKVKTRDICYAAHIDRCIYQLYSFILNELYNDRVKQDGISSVAVAYRTDLFESNIEFSKRAFDFIRAHSPCYVMIGDFTGFFDNLDHNYLKEQWCHLLEVSRLPADHFAVFKNITKYSKWELTDLLRLNGLEDTFSGRHSLNALQQVLTHEQFVKNRTHIAKNQNSFGIPQGSPISALLANVYMLEIDKKINDLVTALGGMYMRYSDDFILILPNLEQSQAVIELSQVINLLNDTPGLTLEPDKTQYFFYDAPLLTNCGTVFHANADCRKRFVNFLGFTFDGEKVSVRSKTTAKYYYRMYRKVKTISACGGYTPNGKRISGKNLYERYSSRGIHSSQGNYLTYVERAKSVFGENEAIDRDTKRHMQKIRAALKKQD